MPDKTLANMLSSLRKRLSAVEDERAKLKRAVEAVAALVEPDRQQTSLLEAEKEVSEAPTYAEAAEAVLKGMGRPLHIQPILGALQARWFPDKDPADRNFSNAVYAALARRDDMFVRTGAAMFGLLAWMSTENGTAPASEKSEVGEG